MGPQYFRFVRWSLAHAGDLPRLYELAEQVAEARGVRPRWEAMKPLGDASVDILDDFPSDLIKTLGDDSPGRNSEGDDVVTLSELEDQVIAAVRAAAESSPELPRRTTVGEKREIVTASAAAQAAAAAFDVERLRKLYEIFKFILPLLLQLAG